MSIGPAEIIVVLVIALLVFGPSRLPQMGRSLGRGVREFKKAADTAKSELGLGEVTDSINEVKATITEPLKEVTGTFTEPLKEVTGTFNDLKSSVDVKSAIEAPVAAAGVAGASAATASEPEPAVAVGAVDEGPETPAVTPATVFADVTPPAAPEAPVAGSVADDALPEAPAVEAPEAPTTTMVAATGEAPRPDAGS